MIQTSKTIFYFPELFIIEQVAWNNSSLLQKNIFQNKQTLKLFTAATKTEFVYRSNQDDKLEGSVDETEWSNKKREEAQAL